MNVQENIALRQKRAKLAADMSTLATEFNSKSDRTAAETTEFNQKFDAMDADCTLLLERITRMERAAELDAETRAHGTQHEREIPGTKPEDAAEARKKAYGEAYNRFLRVGMRGLNEEDRTLLHSGMDSEQINLRATLAAEGTSPNFGAYPGSTTGFFVPVGFQHEIDTALKYYGCMLDGGQDMPRIISTATGAPLPFPTVNDTTVTGARLSENTQVSSVNVNIGQIMLGSWKYTSNLVLVSIELLQDSAFDLNAYLKDTFATRLGRILNTDMTVGTGSSQPNGIITAATSAGTAIGANDNDGVSAANTYGSDDLTTLEHSVDPWYRKGARYMMNDAVLASLKKIKDKYGRPLWMPSVSVNAPDSINGYAYCINNDMAVLQTIASSPTVTNKALVFGQLPKYLIRRVKDMSILRLEERYADFGQVGFLAFARYDGNLIDAGTAPVKYLSTVY